MTRVATATSSQIAADAALETAQAGGNAVDCAIAAALVTMNMEPGVCALAGGTYITVWTAGSDPVVIDGNVAVPGIGSKIDTPQPVVVEMEYGGGVQTLVGASSVGVPGTVAALELASQRYGVAAWSQLFTPCIRHAKDGFPLTRSGHYYLGYAGHRIYGRSADGFAALHDDEGNLRPRGELIQVPHLADSLEHIAQEGARIFYEGELAHAIVSHIQENGGRMTLEDMREYRAIPREPLLTELCGWQIASNPPPAIGGTVLAAMLRLFRDASAANLDEATVAQLVAVQHAVLRYRRDRLDLTHDLAEESAALLAALNTGQFPGKYQSASTVHTSAVDDEGNACAITASSGYGAGDMPAGTGLWLNNCLGEIELNPRGLEAAPAGRRLPSNMTPGAARNGERVLAFGSPGADRITTAIHQFLVNFLQYDMSIEQAISAPRLHVELRDDGDRVAAEPGIATGKLQMPLHQFPELSMYFGGVGAALHEPAGGFQIATDPRRAGGSSVSNR
ncbi:MAG: gamma-glutamyltransferase [Woeseia sp.]|nr:gamma-glutamyltransferase [Woeseia sp.]MBT8096924.1 gamma-glutamyltransferase [Woeseia sp.]NNE61600.1 gamma-glutamyltransferase [Woeseia sp.]NNL55479.1 gamma-glutamyltransferase [Woeseia sp.]